MKFIIPLLSSLVLIGCNGSKPIPFTDISINNVIFSGEGCPGDSDSYVLSSDKKTVSILLDDYRATAGLGTDVTMNRVTCNIAISLHVPTGYRAMLLDADFRGNVELPDRNSTAEFKREYFFADGTSPILTDQWNGVLENESILVEDALEEYGGHLSKCGEDVNLRSNTSLYVSVDAGAETSEIGIDSLDFKGRAQFDYHLNYVVCD